MQETPRSVLREAALDMSASAGVMEVGSVLQENPVTSVPVTLPESLNPLGAAHVRSLMKYILEILHLSSAVAVLSLTVNVTVMGSGHVITRILQIFVVDGGSQEENGR